MLKKYFFFKYFFFGAALLTIFVFADLTQVANAQSAILYFSPANASFQQGESFWLNIMVDAKGKNVNAIAAYFAYPEDKLESLGVNTAGSVMSIWSEKNAGSGKVAISGGLPTPGFSGIQKVASVGFKTKVSSGSVSLKFGSDSAVVTDADNKDILSLTLSGAGNYSFKTKSLVPTPTPPPQATQAPQPAQDTGPLAISDVVVGKAKKNEITITWKTNKEANSVIDYGISIPYLLSTSDSELVKEHSLTLSELLPGTAYHFQITSQVKDGSLVKTEDAIFSSLGFKAEIKISDFYSRKPIAGAEVSTSGVTPITKTTNEEGKVLFENLSFGRQPIFVKYQEDSFIDAIKIKDAEETQYFEVALNRPGWLNLPTMIVSTVLILALLIYLISKVLARRVFQVSNPYSR